MVELSTGEVSTDQGDVADEVRREIDALFAPDGPIASVLPFFQVRQSQLDMAYAVGEAIAKQTTAVVEAGTGTGKTFAYLFPALALAKKVIVSTGTKNLQHQLVEKDLPVALEALEQPKRVALLKGRNNYLCRYRLEQHQVIEHLFSATQLRQFRQIEQWSQATRKGDISELSQVPEQESIWGYATSSAENCLGQECPYVDDCYLTKARKAALEADLVVINHHLFFADAQLREEGFGELLPEADLIILDEAHQLSETATRFFGMTLSSRKILRICRDIEAEVRESARDMDGLLESVGLLEPLAQEIQQVLDRATTESKGSWLLLLQQSAVKRVMQDLGDRLNDVNKQMEQAGLRSRGLQSCQRRMNDLMAFYRVIMAADQGESADLGYVYWFERFKHSFMIHASPLSVAETFSAYRDTFKAAWVFTSATLAVNNRFTHFREPLGLEEPIERLLPSPFDYPSQACMYSPQGMPPPNSPEFVPAVVNMAVPILEAVQGRTFMLFTSHAALQRAAELLADQIDYPLLVQGEANKSALLDKFRSLGNAVLLATGDFWEGVDVRGEALSCVIIDKLPFASPGEPIVKARIEHISSTGGNPFMEYQLPSAVIGLKQGVGRLIRDESDRGVLVICDPRLYGARYGSVVRRSLPPMAATRDWEVLQAFIETLPTSDDDIIEVDADTGIDIH